MPRNLHEWSTAGAYLLAVAAVGIVLPWAMYLFGVLP